MTTKRTQCGGAEEIKTETSAIPTKIRKVTAPPVNPRHNHARQELFKFTITKQSSAAFCKRARSKPRLVARPSLPVTTPETCTRIRRVYVLRTIVSTRV